MSFFTHIYNRIINIGTHHVWGIDEKAKIRVVNLAILHALISTLIVIQLITELKLYVITYGIYIVCLFFTLWLNHHNKFEFARRFLFYITLFYLTVLSILSDNALMVEYIIIVSVFVAYADFSDKKASLIPSIVGFCAFVVVQIVNHYDWVKYPLPIHKEVIFYINLIVFVVLLWNAFTELRREIYKYKDDIDQKHAELVEADKLKNKLFSIIGHDLRQPFNNIQGLLELLESTDLDENTRINIVKRIRNSNQNVLTTLENLLHWGVSMQKGGTFTQQRIQLQASIESIFEVLQESANAKNIELENHLDNTLVALINKDHFELIVRNLVANAIKFSFPKSKITLTGIANPTKQEVLLKIQDRGVGMNPETQAKLFVHENIISTKGTAKEKGTGLGLMLCKDFIEKNNGKIHIISEEGKGTTVELILKMV